MRATEVRLPALLSAWLWGNSAGSKLLIRSAFLMHVFLVKFPLLVASLGK